jgi:hypothetical protein
MNNDIANELVALKDRRDGMIHVRRVHDWARQHPNSAVAQRLEWDDTKAGHQYRLDQIRRLIQIHVVTPDTSVRSVVSLSIDQTKKGGGYRELSSVLPNKSMRLTLVCQVLDELDRVVGRYPQLAELNSVSEAIGTTRRTIEGEQMPMAAD